MTSLLQYNILSQPLKTYKLVDTACQLFAYRKDEQYQWQDQFIYPSHKNKTVEGVGKRGKKEVFFSQAHKHHILLHDTGPICVSRWFVCLSQGTQPI